jgi:ligand-binding SRPBCC domain-containing protein
VLIGTTLFPPVVPVQAEGARQARYARGELEAQSDVVDATSGGSRRLTDSGLVVDVLTEIEIERPRDEVSAFAANPDNATAWYKNIKAVEWETPPPLVVGSRIRFRAQFLGRTLEYTYEVRQLQHGQHFVMTTAQGPFPMETTYSWEDTPDGATKMTLRNRGEPSGFAAMGAPVMARAMRKANEADLRRLKSLLEH